MLFVDRFMQTDRGRTIDLASGLEVSLHPVALPDRAALDTWTRRCATLLEIGCPSLVPLVDFGLAGHGRHFEAIGCRRPCAAWRNRDETTGDALLSLVASLHGHGLSAGTLQWCNVVEIDGRPMLLPDELTGSPLVDAATAEDGAEIARTRETAALSRMLSECQGSHRRTPPRATRPPHAVSSGSPVVNWPAMQCRLLDVLETGISGSPRRLDLRVPGEAAASVINLVARASRLCGYVPVAGSIMRQATLARATAEEVRALLRGRHVLVVEREADRASGEAAAALFLALGLDSHRPHVLLRLGREASTYCRPDDRRSGALLAREHQVHYSGTMAAAAPPLPSAPTPLPKAVVAAGRGGVAASRSRVAGALECASKGRHALAARTLRETLGMHTRRNDRASAAESALALGRVLLCRGHVGEAGKAFEQARVLFEGAGMTPESIRAAVFVGLAWTDAGRWLEAEGAIRAALIAAGTTGDEPAVLFAGLALSRCLLWQERSRDALESLPADPPPARVGSRVSELSGAASLDRDASLYAPLDPRVVRAALAARIALERDDLRTAGAAAAAACERASALECPADLALACTALAQVHAAVGDVEALRRQVADGLAAARLAHAPLRALRLRVALADGLMRAGKGADARSLLSRLAGLDSRGLPAVIRRRVERVLEARGAAGPAGRPAPRSGAIDPHVVSPTATCRSDLVDAVIEVLGYCQSMDDEQALTRKVVAAVRERTRAVVVACVAVDDSGGVVIAAEGREPHPLEVARRAIEVGLSIGPAATASRLEAAVPVRCGGQIVGAMACRWAADTVPDWRGTQAVLSATAAALAPCVRSMLDRRAAPASPSGGRDDDILGVSAGTETLRAEIARAARAPFNVVIEGESGSGKELVARAIHRLGPRRNHRLCAVNCAALTDELLEAELFGHARGAFTGAIAERKGLFEEADRGSLVLDEIGELTPRAQAKLLRAIQEGEVRRLGENFPRPVDVRILAASNRPLRTAADAGAFRRDLLYRLEVIRIVVPPLRDRVDDIPLLAARFWEQATSRLGSRATLAPATVGALARYDWPGNVRELQNVMAALAVGAGRRGSVGPDRLPAAVARQALPEGSATLDEARRVFETRFVRAALARAGGRRAQAARDLGLTRQGLSKLLARLEIGGEADATLA